jgi:hypothetical protein
MIFAKVKSRFALPALFSRLHFETTHSPIGCKLKGARDFRIA